MERGGRSLVAIRCTGKVVTSSDTLEYCQLTVGDLSSSRHCTSSAVHPDIRNARRAVAPGRVAEALDLAIAVLSGSKNVAPLGGVWTGS